MLPSLIFSQKKTSNSSVIIPIEVVSINVKDYNINPGDTVFFSAGVREFLYVRDFEGDIENPIVFSNINGKVIINNTNHYYGIKFVNCKYIKITGTGVKGIEYGFKVAEIGKGNGIEITGFSTDVEIEKVEISNTPFAGIMAKSDPTPDGRFNRDNFTMYNISIHDNYIHDSGGEGLYIGHSWYNGYPYKDDEVELTLYPHAIKGLTVYNNTIKRTQWDGIQVGCADEDVVIDGNKIEEYGLAEVFGQNSGMSIGAGTVGDIKNNKIYLVKEKIIFIII